MKPFNSLVGALLLLFCSGCAIGNKYNYHDTVAAFTATGSSAVAVATCDQRSYILDKDKDPDFIGIQRGGYANPFDVTTVTGKPLSDEITEAMAKSLTLRGFKTTSMSTGVGEQPESVLRKLEATGSTRCVLLKLNEWKSDAMMNTALIYDATLAVYDTNGTLLGSSHIQGRDDLGGSFWNAPGHAKEAVPRAFQKKLEEMFNAAEVTRALQQ